MDNVSKVKAAARLSEVMGEHVRLKFSGKNITCCCPFHNDKNPSMSIDDERGFYHCFGCGESGDVFTFCTKFLGLEFKEALKMLAERYGVELSGGFGARKKIEPNDALKLLQELFVGELAKNATALRYLRSRGLSDKSIADFGLGYAPSNAASLQALERSGIPAAAALAQGAIKRKDDGSVYASFIERITYPISDENGRLIGFGGRTLNPDNPAKYVNSPNSALFDKKRVFYGFFAAKSAMRRAKMLLICEGYMDVIAFHQSGADFAVAALGTAMSEQHLRLIARDVFVRLCFDTDAPGQAAAFKAAALLAQNGYNGDVINLSPHKDAGEMLQQGKAQQLRERAQIAGENIISFAMDYIFKQKLNVTSLDEAAGADPFVLREALRSVSEFAATLEGFLARAHLELFAKRLGMDGESLRLLASSAGRGRASGSGWAGGGAGASGSGFAGGGAGASGAAVAHIYNRYARAREAGAGAAMGAGAASGGFAGQNRAQIPAPSENPLFSQNQGQNRAQIPAPETAAATAGENPLFSQNRAQPLDLRAIPPTEASIIAFICAHRKDFGDILRTEVFYAAPLVALLRAQEFDAPQLLEFRQNYREPLLDIVGFLHNLAQLYAGAESGQRAQFYRKFAATLAACAPRLKASPERLAAAYMLLLRINALGAFDAQQLRALGEEIDLLGAK